MAGNAKTLVVGGGISGLTLALTLHRAKVPVTVLEAAEAPGGVARTVEREGFLLEMGPNSVLDRDGAVAALAASLGVQVQPAAPSATQRAVVLGGQVRNLPRFPPALLTSDVLPLGAKLRLLLEVFSGRGAPGVDESLADFARRHVGDAVTSTLVDAVQTGIWAGDIEKLSAASAFPRLVALEREHRSLLLGVLRRRRGGAAAARTLSFAGGVGALASAAADELGERVHLRTPAQRLQREADGWRVSTPTGPHLAARLVLALPPAEASVLVRPLDGGLADALGEFPSVAVAVVHLGFRPALEAPPEGFGFLVPPSEGRPILGTLYTSSAFPFRAPPDATLLTILLGGAHGGELASSEEGTLLALARAELAALLGVQRTPSLGQVFRWPRAIPQYNVGHAQRVEAAFARTGRWPGLWLAGNAYGGAGVADCIRSASELGQRLLAR
jgi:protoporphyrinogen/coproporphyrinogen III oxidase